MWNMNPDVQRSEGVYWTLDLLIPEIFASTPRDWLVERVLALTS